MDLDPGICPAAFLLKRSELSTFIQGTPGGDDPVACFSNCGKYKYPLEPDLSCDPNPATDPRCYYWKSFRCAFPVPGTSPYGVSCGQDGQGQCAQNGGCWDNGDGQSVCACRAFIEDATCPPDVCTFPYTPQMPSNQPPFGHCSDVTNATGDPSACIGDDTIHRVMPYGLTWPKRSGDPLQRRARVPHRVRTGRHQHSDHAVGTDRCVQQSTGRLWI